MKEYLSGILFAFSEEIRLRIVVLLRNGSSLCVNCIVGALGSPQPTVSRHLSILRNAGIVGVDRNKQNSYYSLNTSGPLGPLKRKLIDAYTGSLGSSSPFKNDFNQIRKIKNQCHHDCELKRR
jgi:DNA-binding transcriptional ArsR family regulator